MDKKLKIIIGVGIIISLILIGVVVYNVIEYREKQKELEELQQQIQQMNQEDKDDVVENETPENTTNETTNTTTQNTSNTANTATTPQTNTAGSEVVGREEQESQNTVNQEEKAIALVKKEWGEYDATVSYAVATKLDDSYIVSVTNNTTTQVVAWYEVNPVAGTVEKQ